MSHLVNLIQELIDQGIGFKSLQDGAIDTTTASGEFMFNIFSALAQFERRLIQEWTVPVPELFLIEIHHYFKAQLTVEQTPLWSVSRHLVWRIVKHAMKMANINGVQATPTGMRHSFAIACLETKPPIPLHILQGWLGHRNYELTCSYLPAITIDEDEQTYAKRLWASDK